MIRYSINVILMLLCAFVVQQFLPALTGLYDSRILLVHLVFLCCAITVEPPTMLVLAFIGGFLWDAQCALGPHGGDPQVYVQQVADLRFGYSILLFGGMGYLMQGIRPWFKQGKWQFSVLLSGVAVFLYLVCEYGIITLVRGGFLLAEATVLKMLWTSLLTMVFSPLVFWLLFRIAGLCNYSIKPESGRRRQHA